MVNSIRLPQNLAHEQAVDINKKIKGIHVVLLQLLLLAAITNALNIWPAPKDIVSGNATTSIGGNLDETFFQLDGDSELLKQAFERYSTLTFPHVSHSSNGGISSLNIHVDDLDESHPQLGVDESYNLDVTSSEATLKSKTVWGALRGLETFSQIVSFDFEDETYYIPSTPISIDDAPRFPHRGLMIDSARHFETLQAIKSIIDSLTYAKLNTLHWHMVDTQSFPFQSKAYPNLWEGAYSDEERYTQDDIATIVEYARVRGVRVYVEFDVPGHAQSWCKGYPEICPSETCMTPLNVANNKTFDVIDGLLEEVTGGAASTKGSPSGLFPDNFVHLGGDEVDTSCWSKTPAIQTWLSNANLTPDEGYAYFAKRASDIAISKGRRPIQWSEVYDHFKTELDKKTVVHIWKSVTNVTEVLANGYNVLLNVGYAPKSWYLDNLNVNFTSVYVSCLGIYIFFSSILRHVLHTIHHYI